MLEKLRSKLRKNIAGSSRETAREINYDRENAAGMSSMDIIVEDTDVLSEEARFVFTLPPAPPEIADYLAHYFRPAEQGM